MLRVLALVFLVTAWAAPAHALTDKEIARWAVSMASMNQWLQSTDPETQAAFRGGLQGLSPNQMPTPEQIKRIREPYAYAVSVIDGRGLGAEPTAIVTAQGFAGLTEWAALSDRIMRAFISHRLRGRAPSRVEVEAQIAQIEASATMSEAQKAAAKNRLEQGLRIVDIMADVPDSDVVAIRQNLSIVGNVFGR